MKEALISTALHILELVVCLVASIVVLRFFHLGDDQEGIIIGVVVNAISKFARAAEFSPVEDWVNKK